MSIRTKENKCIECGYLSNEATSITHGSGPQAGSISICFGCGMLGVYNEDLTIHRMTVPEKLKLMIDHPATWREIERARVAITLTKNKN